MVGERESVCVCCEGGHVCACVWEPSSRWTNGCAGIEWAEAMEAGRSGVSGGRLWYGGAVSLRARADGQREARSFDTSMSRAGVSWGILRSFSGVSGVSCAVPVCVVAKGRCTRPSEMCTLLGRNTRFACSHASWALRRLARAHPKTYAGLKHL